MSAERPSLVDLVREYWRAYGGTASLFRSPYLYSAFAISLVLFGLWTKVGWWADVLAIVPGLMGISLAAFALFLSAGSEKFRQMLAGKESFAASSSEPSPFLRAAAVFLHFLLVQFLATMAALVAKSASTVVAPIMLESIVQFLAPGFWFLGFFLFIYALVLIVAAGFAVFEVVNWFDEFASIENENDDLR